MRVQGKVDLVDLYAKLAISASARHFKNSLQVENYWAPQL